MTSKVFVGNLSYDTMENELQGLFSEVGQVVEVFLPIDRATGRPRGFAFVELADDAAVAAAIEKLDGRELNGRTLRVSQAEEQTRRAPHFSDARSPSWQQGPKRSRPKGSRRNIRARKRGL